MDSAEKQASKFTLSYVIASLTFVIPIMYLCGYLYHAGYLGGYGINEDYFELGFEAYLVKFFLFFIHIFSVVLKLTTSASTIMAAGVFVFLYGFILYGMYELSFQVVSWKKRLKEKYRGKEHFGWIMVPTLIAGVGVGVPLVFISIIAFAVLVVLNSYTVGANRATDEIKAFVQCDHPEARCTRIFSGTDLIAEGKIVTVSAKSLAVFDGHRVLILDHDNLRVETEIQKQHR